MDKSTLLGYMHNYYETSSVVGEHLNANAIELTTFKTKLDNVLNQFFVDTADYTLSRWEKQLGIPVNENIATEFRRSRIKSKLRGQGTITVAMIKNVAESFQNGEVNVIEDNANYSFTIKFVSTKGIPPNISDLQKAIEDIKPAHLAYTLAYTYNTWSQVSSYKWSDVSSLTWEQFATMTI